MTERAPTTESVLAINEIFGPTLQGEGPDIGKPCFFLRLYGCPVQCQWCDTSWTWDPAQRDGEVYVETVSLVAKRLRDTAYNVPVGRLVISGGEPMTQAPALLELTRAIAAVLPHVEIETSGIIPPLPGLIAQYNVSPKLAHARARVPYAIDVLRQYGRLAQPQTRLARFKFVVDSLSDFEELDDIVAQAGIPRDAVWVMPLGTARHDLVARGATIAEATIARGYNTTTRLHVLLWGNTRGV